MDKGWVMDHGFICGADVATPFPNFTQVYKLALLDPMLEEFKGMFYRPKHLHLQIHSHTSSWYSNRLLAKPRVFRQNL